MSSKVYRKSYNQWYKKGNKLKKLKKYEDVAIIKTKADMWTNIEIKKVWTISQCKKKVNQFISNERKYTEK